MAFKVPESTKKVNTNLNHFVTMKQAELTLKYGRKIKLSEIQEIIGNECNVSAHTIKQIRQHLSVPSVELALRLAKYFNVQVEDIYSLNEELD